MKLSVPTVVYMTIFGASICIFAEVMGEDVYCFSCFGYTGEKPWLSEGAQSTGKCEDRDGGNLVVRKCTKGKPSEKPMCIRFTAKYKLPYLKGNRLQEGMFEASGLHCGTIEQCRKNQCPNYWSKDVREIKDCEVSCCGSHESANCTFPFPRSTEVIAYKMRRGEDDGEVGLAAFSGESSNRSKPGWPVWALYVSFIIFSICR
ncbi:uncharacterized protein LOC114961794 [Acropora millepora]|uniref:uncharacterized protein LOC114961794 n=1 Tax=Acropora millepora TaxID=45264 RepID=UPI001CF3E143|nr:uncharacterized protein LOC114961794 [Acropora millepora]